MCVAGQWRRGKWVGSAGREECERKYRLWVDHLGQCVDCSGGDESGGGEVASGGGGAAAGPGATVESHAVHPVLDRFIFAARGWSPAPPLPATSNDCGVDERRRRAVVSAWEAARRQQKHERRSGKWSDDQRAAHERQRHARETTVRVTLEPWGRGRGARLRLVSQVHEGRFVPFLGSGD